MLTQCVQNEQVRLSGLFEKSTILLTHHHGENIDSFSQNSTKFLLSYNHFYIAYILIFHISKRANNFRVSIGFQVSRNLETRNPETQHYVLDCR